MYYILMLTILSLDIVVEGRGCSTYCTRPYTVPVQGDSLNSAHRVDIIIRPERPRETFYTSSSRSGTPGQRRSLVSSGLQIPGMLVDKLISGQITV